MPRLTLGVSDREEIVCRVLGDGEIVVSVHVSKRRVRIEAPSGVEIFRRLATPNEAGIAEAVKNEKS